MVQGLNCTFPLDDLSCSSPSRQVIACLIPLVDDLQASSWAFIVRVASQWLVLALAPVGERDVPPVAARTAERTG